MSARASGGVPDNFVLPWLVAGPRGADIVPDIPQDRRNRNLASVIEFHNEALELVRAWTGVQDVPFPSRAVLFPHEHLRIIYGTPISEAGPQRTIDLIFERLYAAAERDRISSRERRSARKRRAGAERDKQAKRRRRCEEHESPPHSRQRSDSPSPSPPPPTHLLSLAGLA
jgi:hypothetical protein